MKWKQKNKALTSILEVIEANSGQKAHELINPPKNPYLVNLKETAELIKTYLKQGLTPHIVGDYDTDGICASAIMFLALLELTGKEPHVRLPRRFTEGYGLSMKIIDEIDDGFIITVDNGIAALAQVDAANQKDIPVIVTDHHLPVRNEKGEMLLPKADIILDPHINNASEFSDYCGAALAYRLALELLPTDSKICAPLLALAGIATVADVMPLIGDNRNLVLGSLQVIQNRNVTLGLNELLNQLNLSYVSEGDYGFRLGPVMNAAGRMDDNGPMKVLKVLTTNGYPCDDNFMKKQMKLIDDVAELLQYNKKRQESSRLSLSRAHAIITEEKMENDIPLVIYDPECSEGIIGIIAGHLAEEYKRPVLYFTDTEKEGVIKGSGRTFGTVHLKKLLDSVSDDLLGYGGHAGAAGMSTMKNNLQDLRKHLVTRLEGVDMGVDPDTLIYDLEISMNEIPTCIRELKNYAPYGEGNPAPIFKFDGFRLSPRSGSFFKAMGTHGQHLKFYGKDISAVGFDMSQRYQEDGEPRVMDMIGRLQENYFMGKFYNQIECLDYKNAETHQKTDVFKSLEELLTFN